MKKLIKIGIISLVGVLTLTGCGCSKNDSEKNKEQVPNTKEQYNTNEGVVGDKTQDGLTFTNTSLSYSSKGSTLETKVTNTTNQNIKLQIFDIFVKDKSGNTLVKLQGYVGDEIPAGQSKDIVSSTDMNLEGAYTIEYELVD